jgi:hypothetical protein
MTRQQVVNLVLGFFFFFFYHVSLVSEFVDPGAELRE